VNHPFGLDAKQPSVGSGSSGAVTPIASSSKDTSPIDFPSAYPSNKGRRQPEGPKQQLHDPRRIQARARVGQQTPPPPDGSPTTASSNTKRFNHYANLTDMDFKNKGSNDPPTVYERDADSDDEEDNIFRAEI